MDLHHSSDAPDSLPPPDGFHRMVLDAMPDPVFIVDEDVRIFDCNKAASDRTDSTLEQLFARRGGDVLSCVNALEGSGGCGKAAACKTCKIRNSVTLAFNGEQPRRVTHRLKIVKGERTEDVHLLVTTAPIPYCGRKLALLVLEDISELVALRRIVPMCACCGNVRDDKEYWQKVETYCRRNLDVDFSHGICPECMKTMYPEYADDL